MLSMTPVMLEETVNPFVGDQRDTDLGSTRQILIIFTKKK